MEKVTALEKRLGNSQAVGSDMFRNQIFNTQMDVSNYMRQFIDSPSVAPTLINDCFTLLHSISKGMMAESMELKDIYSVTRMGSDISKLIFPTQLQETKQVFLHFLRVQIVHQLEDSLLVQALVQDTTLREFLLTLPGDIPVRTMELYTELCLSWITLLFRKLAMISMPGYTTLRWLHSWNICWIVLRTSTVSYSHSSQILTLS